MDDRWKKVLLLQTSFLGDTVLTLPLISEIRRRFSSAHLTVMCSPLAADLLRGHPAIDEIIVDDKRGADKGIAGLWRKAQRLRHNGYTLALTPHKSLRSALLLYLAAIPWRVGFRQSAGWFLFHVRAQRRAAQHDHRKDAVDPGAVRYRSQRLPMQFKPSALARITRGRGQAAGVIVDPG
jgi:heptosyltransferase-2